MIKIVLAMVIAAGLYGDNLSSYVDGSEAVANKVEVPKVTITELSYMLTGKINHWSDGSRIYVYTKKSDDYSQKMLIVSILGMSVSRYKEIVEDNDNIIEVEADQLTNKLIQKIGSLGIISINKLILCTENGLVTVEIVE